MRSKVLADWVRSAEFDRLAASHYPLDRPPRAAPDRPRSRHVVHPDRPKQLIKGLGFEIMSDSIGAANVGVPEEPLAVPHDLVPTERTRFFSEMLGGFRYCRLAAGLYWRGETADRRAFAARWPGQLDELQEMIKGAGLEGISLEYWSPAPFWKGTNALNGNGDPRNRLRCFVEDFADDPTYQGDVDRFLHDLAGAFVRDLETLHAAGIPVAMWNMQAEPFSDSTYPTCPYDEADYARTLRVVAPYIRKYDPAIQIIADSGSWWDFRFVRPLLDDPATVGLIDALVIHLIGWDSKDIAPPDEPSGKPRFNNEFEYLWGTATPSRCLNTVQSIMNWFQLADAPTWFWLHALKPLSYSDASGYALGLWRPSNYIPQQVSTTLPAEAWRRDPNDPYLLEPGHWCWNKYNWHAVGSFVRRMPWDCRSLTVTEADGADDDLRVLAYRKPDGKHAVVVSNRSFASHVFNIDTQLVGSRFHGYRYTPESAGPDTMGVALGSMDGPVIAPTVPDMAWEFWEQT